MNRKDKVKLIYYFDALCGWCYGFSPVMSKLQQEFGDRLNIEVISSGLFLDHKAGLVNEVAPHIRAGAYKDVESKRDVKFGKTFLADVFGEGKIVLNSLPPSIALCIVKEKFPEKGVKFAEILLNAVYLDGMSSTDIKGYANYAEKIGFNLDDFNTKIKDNKYQKAAEKEFEMFRNNQLSGMPTLILEIDEKKVLISNGDIDFEELKFRIEKYVA